jgi:hypothetical protein
MSEFEMFEALMMSIELAVVASMNFLAIVIAFLVASYVVGKELPRSIAVGMTICYTLFLLPPFSGTYRNLTRVYEIGEILLVTYPDTVLSTRGDLQSATFLVALFLVPMFAGWLGSIYFLHGHIRGKADA